MRKFVLASVGWMLFCACLSSGSAAEQVGPEAPTAQRGLEHLVFQDGDRLTGWLLRREGDTFVFQSLHVGEVRVPAGSARLEPAMPVAGELGPAATVAPTATVDPQPLEASVSGEALRVGPEAARMVPWWRSPSAVTDRVFGFLGPWKGRFAFTLSLTQDTGNGENYGADLSFSRKWTNDEAKFETHYYFTETDDRVKTDLFKGRGNIRHDFKGPFFLSYRPTVEWNRNHFVNGAPADYVLAQQSIGGGINVLDGKGRKVGLGVAENIFDLWTIDQGGHSTRDSQSLFGEFDFELPWRINISGRATWYYTLSTGDRGWEDQFELTKRFSDTLSLGVRREARHNNPDERIADYSLVRVQLGLDF